MGFYWTDIVRIFEGSESGDFGLVILTERISCGTQSEIHSHDNIKDWQVIVLALIPGRSRGE